MSIFKQEPGNVDLEQYLNLDQIFQSRSPSVASIKGKGIASPSAFQAPTLQSTFVPSQKSPQLRFSAPSHQYGQFKQHASFAPGAVANTLQVAQATDFQTAGYPYSYTGNLSAPSFDISSPDNDFDFDFNSFGGDMDMDFDTSFTDIVESNNAGAAYAQRSIPAPVQRLYPGMHSQAAAAAKANQQKQIEMQQQQAQQAGPSSAGMLAPNHIIHGKAKDPVVEERISRLLSQMRHDSVVSTTSDSDPSQSNHQTSGSKKEEEEMDEDERLLASEEGKKLSSKERRQLRNKVSARAFRSRRKEYIGQLEGEIAAKAKEADDLRDENDALKAENNRLSDLSRMLLSHPSFSSFLKDFPASGASVPTLSSQPTLRPQAPQDRAHAGMTIIPENNMDFSNFQPPQNVFGAGSTFNYNMQTFAVTELPEGPLIDASVLSGKMSAGESVFSSAPSKLDYPVVERLPTTESSIGEVEASSDGPASDATESAFALFDGDYAKVKTPATEPKCKLLGSIAPEKAFARIELVVMGEEVSASAVSDITMARFTSLCASLDELSAELQRMITW